MVALDHQSLGCLMVLPYVLFLSTLCSGYAWTASNPQDTGFSILPRNIFKRGVCESANKNTVTNLCTPSSTVCCVQPGKAFPQCIEHNGAGWCCNNSGSKQCYVDLPSDCSAPGAVHCPHLAEGVKQACCPQGTTCAPGNQTSKVRCNIPLARVQSKATSTSTTKSTSTSSTSPATTTASQPSPVPTNSSSFSGISSGAIAGIAVGAIAVIAALFLWFFLRRRRHLGQARAQSPTFVPLQHQAYNTSETDITKKSGHSTSESAFMPEASSNEVHEMSGNLLNTNPPNTNPNVSEQYKAMVRSELDGMQKTQKSSRAERGEVHEMGTE